ncbi:MAG: DNA primase [Rhodopseudomonas sp.]|nr:DNA primase [Rhodopseudomonas sp.]
MSSFSRAQIDELRAREPVSKWAATWVSLRPGSSKFKRAGFTGPCPLHSLRTDARDSTSFECDAEGWVCATCGDGGDIFKLVALRHGLDPRRDFSKVVEILGGTRQIDPAEEKRLEAERAARAAAQDAQQNEWRERERGQAYDLYYKYGIPLSEPAAQPARDYLRQARGLDFPDNVLLRFDPAARFYVPDKPRARLIHTGPALLGAIRRDGHFAGVHTTWFDLDRPKGKALIVDPKTGEALGTKKMRGSKKGGHIELTPCPEPHTLVLGEGIEKVLAIWTAMHGAARDPSTIGFWSAADLGNIAGKAKEPVPHPTAKTPTGRVKRVPGPAADLLAPAIDVPDTVRRLVLLGDSTSDRFSTQCVMARAGDRYMRAGREIVVAWAPDGSDFDDLLREAA